MRSRAFSHAVTYSAEAAIISGDDASRDVKSLTASWATRAWWAALGACADPDEDDASGDEKMEPPVDAVPALMGFWS